MKNKKIIIIGIIIVILVVAGLVGYFFINKDKMDQSDWSTRYYNSLLSDTKEQELQVITPDNRDVRNEKFDTYLNTSDCKLSFIEVSDKFKPIMVVNYKKNGHSCFKFGYLHFDKNISEDEILGYESFPNEYMLTEEQFNLDYDLQLLYNIEKQKYEWYVHYTDESEKENYILLLNSLSGLDEFHDKSSNSYIFTKEEMKSDENSISKFEETFITVDIELSQTEMGDIHYIEEKPLKKFVKEARENFKTLYELITDEIKSKTQEKLKELENKKEKIRLAEEAAKKEAEEKAAREAEEKAKAEEEARRKAAEEAAKGLKIGSYTLKYGTYSGREGQYDGEGVVNWNVSINIKSDGTYTLTSSNQSMQPSSSGTYEVTTVGGKPAIQLSKGGMYEVISNEKLQVPAGSGAIFTYQGN